MCENPVLGVWFRGTFRGEQVVKVVVVKIKIGSFSSVFVENLPLILLGPSSRVWTRDLVCLIKWSFPYNDFGLQKYVRNNGLKTTAK